jgi:hypothetical protein
LLLVPSRPGAFTATRSRQLASRGPGAIHHSSRGPIHLHAAWFALGFVALASMVAGLGGPAGFIFRLTLMAYAWLYFVIALRRVYGLRVRGAVWRSITVLFLHTIVLSTAVNFIGLAGAGVVFPREGG